MAKKRQKMDWPEAIKLCRLNQNDVAMAKKLGFSPEALIGARPDPKQRWKLPVKYWIHELHKKKFGNVMGEGPLKPAPIARSDAPGPCEFGEPFYWGADATELEEIHPKNDEVHFAGSDRDDIPF